MFLNGKVTPPRPPGVLPTSNGNGSSPPAASIDLLDNNDSSTSTPSPASNLFHQFPTMPIVIPAGNPSARAYLDPFWTLPRAADEKPNP
jgi:hypothetical protein